MSRPTVVGGLLKDLAELEGEEQTPQSPKYDACLMIKGAFDGSKLPDIKNAITKELGSKVEVAYDNVKNCFYVDGAEEDIAKVMEVLKGLGVETEKEQKQELPPEEIPAPVAPAENYMSGEDDDESDRINPNLIRKAEEVYKQLKRDLKPLAEFLDVADPVYAESDKELEDSIREAESVIKLLKSLKYITG